MIGRRGFLGGVIAAISGGEALVKLASPVEAQILKPGHAAAFHTPVVGIPKESPGQIYIALTTGDGLQYEALGWLQNITVHHDMDTIAYHDYDMVVKHARGFQQSSANFRMTPIHQKGSPLW